VSVYVHCEAASKYLFVVLTFGLLRDKKSTVQIKMKKYAGFCALFFFTKMAKPFVTKLKLQLDTALLLFKSETKVSL